MDDHIVAALACVLIFGGPVAAFVIMRGMQHRERMEMIRHGIVPPMRGRRDWRPEESPAPPPSAAANSGYYYTGGWDEPPQRMLRKAMGLTAVGFALTLGLGFIGFLVDPGRFVPGPWLLGGLIPLFIGLAQVFGAIMSGARLGPPAQNNPYAATFGQQSKPPPNMPPPSYDASAYTYRPDGAQQELVRPPTPPERR
jgi:uncharacterized protein DUF6249